MDKLQEHTQAIKEAVIALKASGAKFREVLSKTGSYKHAHAASDEITGGSKRFWDKLGDDGHLVCMVVTCPAATDHHARKVNETCLRQIIMKLDAQLSEFMLDLFISRKEIEKGIETIVICRFPSFCSIKVCTILHPT